MPLNKLDNFLKNTEGRILYVSPADLDSTDSILNTGNSLARPFKTIQRALLEAARFTYVQGNSNDETEKTTILLMPGEHVIDNRPGWTLFDDGGVAKVNRSDAPNTDEVVPADFYFSLDSNFDITQPGNHLHRFNSIHGGVIVPRGVSIVGLDLRKTKIRPKYVPNPTDSSTPASSIFKITGACYFWQFSILDGDELGDVYTKHDNFGATNRTIPTFSHHKLTAFEYADGVNIVPKSGLTDLQMYYGKLSLAYGTGVPDREVRTEDKFPGNLKGFEPQRPEYEIVGAFAPDPIKIASGGIEAGIGGVVSPIVKVTTETPHGLTVGTPIRIVGVGVDDSTNYNVSTKVTRVDQDNPNVFEYTLAYAPAEMTTPGVTSGNEFVFVETDTVSGASPYIFNVSLRSVWGMSGMHADGSKATGFRSMVVAQFTGVSLQKDDRAFVKYKKDTRDYSDNISITPQYGGVLSAKSSSEDTAYHLDPDAIYRNGWESTHIKLSNDSFIQVVSVFAIGYNKHFEALSGGDASITNSNSNFGQISLASDGFKKEAFAKDDKAFITHIIPPRAIDIPDTEDEVEWLSIDFDASNTTTRFYLSGFTSEDEIPPVLTQGYRIGARVGDKLYLKLEPDGDEYSADILMPDGSSSFKEYSVGTPSLNVFALSSGTHTLATGEKVIIISDDGDLPENLRTNTVYYAIVPDNTSFKLAASRNDAENDSPIEVYGGTNLRVLSRVSDKIAGDIGHPVQWDGSQWYITIGATGNTIFPVLPSNGTSEATYVKRVPDTRSIDEKIYKLRVVVPKELSNSKTPESGFIIQESSSTGISTGGDSSLSVIDSERYDYNRNPRFISTCSFDGGLNKVTVRTELPHNLTTGDSVIIRNVTDSTNTTGEFNDGYNGTFTVTATSDVEFTYPKTSNVPGAVSTNNTNSRDLDLPRFERNNLQSNFYVYRNEIIQDYVDGERDGIYHFYVLNADNQISQEFTNLKYSQNVVDLYPQLDRDNYNDNPPAARSYAKVSPLGEVSTNDLKKSITRESIDKLATKLGFGREIDTVAGAGTTEPDITFSREHGLNGVVAVSGGAGGSGYSSGTHYNVRLLNTTATGTWNGATAIVPVTGAGAVDIANVKIISPGSNYSASQNLWISADDLPGNGTARVVVSEIFDAVGSVIQFTGTGDESDTYHRITAVNSTTQISIARTTGDPVITSDHYAYIVGPSIDIDEANTTTGIVTTTGAHGLVAGNRVRIIDDSNNNTGDYIVNEVTGYNTLIISGITANSGYILKHAFSANAGISDRSDENLGERAFAIYGGETATLNQNITETTSPFKVTGTNIISKFPLGSYIQIGEEIMRVANDTLQGGSNDELVVIRGALATRQSSHNQNSLIKKVEPKAIEFRRPSYMRASGHTFEYLGYGPGNYSTGLPQVQVKALPEREEFLVQSQERSAGIVVYTGMNNRGDFFIGNQRKSAATGEETTFDTPIPTITGEDPSRLSVVFDEVIIKERLVVEGGASNQILSQFDGPVTFNERTRFTNINKITNKTDSTSTTSGALVVTGGVGIGKTVRIGGDLHLRDNRSIFFGNDDDLQIYHDSTDSYIDNDKGHLYIRNNVDDDDGSNIYIQAKSGENSIVCNDDGSIQLYHDNSLKLETIGTGVTVTGKLDINGNLDLSHSPSNAGILTANYLAVPNISPIGSIMMWPGSINDLPNSPFDYWIPCQGQTLSATTYPGLFTILQYTYGGSGDNFKVPDMQNLFVTGAGGTYNLSVIGGSADATLVSHNHSLDGGGASGTFLTSASVSTTTEGVNSGGAAVVDGVSLSTESGSVSYSQPSVSTEGFSATNANLPPYIALHYIIRIQ